MKQETYLEAERSDEHDALWRFVEALGDEERQPLVLRFAEGLTFSEIATVVGIAESTAFDRVQRGLEQLRKTLLRAGFGALALDLEAGIRRAAPARTPAGLARGLMALEHAGSALAVSSTSLATMALAGAGVMVAAFVAWFALDAARDPAPDAVDSTATARVAADTPDASEVERSPAAERKDRRVAVTSPVAATGSPRLFGRVSGCFADAEGRPLAGCRVTISSVQRQGKVAAYITRATTDVAGNFSAEVEVADSAGGHYAAQAERDGRILVRVPPTLVRAGTTTDLGTVRANANVEPGPGPYSIDLAVVDATGRPVVDVSITLSSLAPTDVDANASLAGWTRHHDRLERQEVRVATDAGGRVRIEGEGVGRKRLVLEPGLADHRVVQLAPRAIELDVTVGEALDLVAVLDDAHEISGVARFYDEPVTPERLAGVTLSLLEPVSGARRFASLAPDGSWCFRGLASGRHRIRVEPATGVTRERAPSKAWIDVEAGTRDVELVLKRADDPRSVGLHAGEIHGRVLAAESGAELLVSRWDVDVLPLRLEHDVDIERDWIPNNLVGPPVQRMADGFESPSNAFRRTGLEAGRYFVRASHRGRGPYVSAPILLGVGEIVSDFEVRLERAAVLTGSVESPDGAALESALVLLTGTGPISEALIVAADERNVQCGGRGFLFVNGTEERARAGRFELTALPPDIALRPVALHPEFEPLVGAPLTLRPGQRRDISLRFERRREPAVTPPRDRR